MLPKSVDISGVIYRSRTIDCVNCPVQKSCPASARKDSKHIKYIFRSHNQQFFKIEKKRMQEPLFQRALRERMWKIEGINAEAKNQHGLKRARYRGLNKVQIQTNMIGALLNIKRLVVFCYVLFRSVITWKVINYSDFLMVGNKLVEIFFPSFLEINKAFCYKKHS